MKKENIEQYLKSFIRGDEYNLFINRIKYVESDIWISKNKWIETAEICIKNNTNILQALEILISTKPKTYFKYAEEIVNKWYQISKHDAYYYYHIIAFFPKNHIIRKKVLTDNYTSFFKNDSTKSNKIAREALIKSNDLTFCKIFGNYLDREIQKNSKNFDILEELILLTSELSHYASKYVSSNSLKILKKFLSNYLYKDKIVANKFIKNTLFNKKERTLWIVDEVVYIAWSLEWYDILDYLKNEEWYWLFLFDENSFYENQDNINLLIWTKYTYNDDLLQRATLISNNNFYNTLDGVIALSRLSQIHKLKEKKVKCLT